MPQDPREVEMDTLTSVEDLADAVEPVGAPRPAGVDVFRVHCGAGFMDDGYENTHGAISSDLGARIWILLILHACMPPQGGGEANLQPLML